MSILVCYTHQKNFPETQGHMTISHRSSATTKITTKHFLSHVSNPGMEHILQGYCYLNERQPHNGSQPRWKTTGMVGYFTVITQISVTAINSN